VLLRNKDHRELADKCIICGHSRFCLIFTKKDRNFWRCSNCKFEKQHPLPEAQELEAFYNSSFEVGLYKEFITAYDMKRTTASYRLKKIECHISNGRLLDIGCADGVFIQQARHAGIEAEGIDISQVAVEKALQLGVPAYCRDIFDHNPKYKYETITGFDVLEHVLDPIRFVDSLKRLLKPGGV
jgi:2-polyprenyl-3-methyl-5-hydroxy-6-metoxy-1,4-benzoquinol methylase